MSQLLTTAAVEPSRQLAYWTEMVCDTHVQLDCDAAADAHTIEGETAVDQLATLQLSRVTSTAQNVRRTPARIAWASEDYFLVSNQAHGSAWWRRTAAAYGAGGARRGAAHL